MGLNSLVPGSANNVIALVADVALPEGKKGQYMAGTLKDATGSMGFKIWEPEGMLEIVKTGEVIQVIDGSASEYKGELQMVIKQATRIPQEILDNWDGYPQSPISELNLEVEFNKLLNTASLSDPALKSVPLVKNTMEDKGYYTMYKNYPAAMKHHQAYRRGLFEHSVAVARMTRAALSLYSPMEAPTVNVGLGILGALFHDIGKIKEYEVNGLWLATGYSKEGLLLTHHMLGCEIIDEIFAEFLDKDYRMKLKHICISHHGLKEWGSATEPKFLEAHTIHQMDMVDSRREAFDVHDPSGIAYSQQLRGSILSAAPTT